jgi:hypothetical protein
MAKKRRTDPNKPRETKPNKPTNPTDGIEVVVQPVYGSIIQPRIDSVVAPGERSFELQNGKDFAPDTASGDLINIFGQNFSPTPAENSIAFTVNYIPPDPSQGYNDYELPTTPPSPDDVVVLIGVSQADPDGHRLEAVVNFNPTVMPSLNGIEGIDGRHAYLLWVNVKGLFSNPFLIFYSPFPQPAPSNTLGPGGRLLPRDFLISNNGRWKLEFRAIDGVLALYDGNSGNEVFSKGQPYAFGPYLGGADFGPSAYPLDDSAQDINGWSHYCEMEAGGNFVMHMTNTGLDDPPFMTNTDGNPGAFLRVEDDGNLVVYNQSGNKMLWNRYGV